MTPQQFTRKFREAFGEAAPMPIAFWYGNTAVNPESRVPRCMIGAIRKVCDGNPLTITNENVQCGGGGLYTAFRPMFEGVPMFVSKNEHYKQTPEQVRAYVESLEIEITDKPYLNFVSVDKLASWIVLRRLYSSLRPMCCRGFALGHFMITMPIMPL